MRQSHLLKTTGLLLVGAGFLATGCGRPPGGQARNALRSADISLISATHGSGTNFAEVTAWVNDLLSEPDGDVFVHPHLLGKDPSPGWNKVLVIVYDCRHRRCLFTTREGGKVNVDILVENANADGH